MTSDTVAPKPRGDVLEGIAFQFCKVATVALVFGRYTLIAASGLACILYIWTFFAGRRDTRCVMHYPLLIAAFWGIVCSIAVWWMWFRPL